MNLRPFRLGMLLLFLTACGNLPAAVANPPAPTNTPQFLTPTPVSKTPTPLPSSTLPTFAPSATPTPRVMGEIPCTAPVPELGHIFFAGGNGLYIMDGNGCFPSFVISLQSPTRPPEWTSSPAWSRDYKKIAIACYENQICIFDANSIIKSCMDYKGDGNTHCKPVLLKKYTAPPEIASNPIDLISWSPDGLQLAIENCHYSSSPETKCFLHILTLSGQGAWKTIAQKSTEGIPHFYADWSPIENILITSGSYLLDSDGKSLGNLRNVIIGTSSQWSPDGTKIAIIVPTNKENYFKIESAGIAILDYKEKTWIWAYKPVKRDEYYWPSQNLALRDQSGQNRELSWSLDGRYLAFVAAYWKNVNGDYIFRLDTQTGEIIILAKDIGGTAPAWGP